VVPKLGHGVYGKPGPGFPNMVLYMIVGNNNEAKVVCCLPSKEVKSSLRVHIDACNVEFVLPFVFS
jgi:hypothetical protein